MVVVVENKTGKLPLKMFDGMSAQSKIIARVILTWPDTCVCVRITYSVCRMPYAVYAHCILYMQGSDMCVMHLSIDDMPNLFLISFIRYGCYFLLLLLLRFVCLLCCACMIFLCGKSCVALFDYPKIE